MLQSALPRAPPIDAGPLGERRGRSCPALRTLQPLPLLSTFTTFVPALCCLFIGMLRAPTVNALTRLEREAAEKGGQALPSTGVAYRVRSKSG
jgi:hypothetical protein